VELLNRPHPFRIANPKPFVGGALLNESDDATPATKSEPPIDAGARRGLTKPEPVSKIVRFP
jgi:hypothetical protein